MGAKFTDLGVVRRELQGSLDLADRALLEAGGRVGPREGEPVVRDARLELDGAAGELDRAPRVRRGFEGRVRDPLVRARVRGPPGARLGVAQRRLGPATLVLLVLGLLPVALR